MDLKKEYETLRKKYSLPSYEELDKEFEILYVPPIQEIAFPLRLVRRRMSDRIVWVCNMFQSMLNPNPNSFVNLQETKFFENKDRDKMVQLLKEFMYIERNSLMLDVDPDEKKDAEVIKEIYQLWNKNKKDIISITEKLRDGWKKETKQEKNNFFG